MMLAAMTPVLVAACTAGFAIMARALPWPEAWRTRKPLACPACMSGWAGFAAIGVAMNAGLLDGVNFWTLAALWGSCIGVSAPIFNAIYPPHHEIELPE